MKNFIFLVCFGTSVAAGVLCQGAHYLRVAHSQCGGATEAAIAQCGEEHQVARLEITWRETHAP